MLHIGDELYHTPKKKRACNKEGASAKKAGAVAVTKTIGHIPALSQDGSDFFYEKTLPGNSVDYGIHTVLEVIRHTLDLMNVSQHHPIARALSLSLSFCVYVSFVALCMQPLQQSILYSPVPLPRLFLYIFL